jgi:transposase InsO family protein
VAPNLLDQDFTATAPNQKYVGDITYLWTDEGWLYLATVIDLYSRLVVGWAMSERMTAQLVCDALKMALWRRGMPTGVIVHSDRGSQYCSGVYQALLDEHGLICHFLRPPPHLPLMYLRAPKLMWLLWKPAWAEGWTPRM